MNTYYKVTATMDGEPDVLYGSFVKADCTHEIEAERESWKAEGYKGIKIISENTTDTPDKEVYKDELVTSHELFMQQAPSFNFEKDEAGLLTHALEVGYVTEVSDNLYLINQDY